MGRRLGIGRAVVVGSILFPAPMALFPLAHGSHWLSGSMLLAGEFLASVGVMIFDVNQNSLMAMLIPQAVRSRVVGVSRFFNYGTRPFGALLGGVLGTAIGLRPTLWIAVVGCLLGAVFLLFSPMPRNARGGPRVSRSEILRHRPAARAARCAEVISTTGAQMTWLALPWFVLTTTGSAARMTFVVLAEVIGLAAAGAPRRAAARGLGARRSMLFADAARAPLMLFVPILHWSGAPLVAGAAAARLPARSLAGALLHGAAGDHAGALRRGRERR